jgi:hypothetical protein
MAAKKISSEPGAMQLRQLQTMVEVSAEKNSTLIFPIPIELLSFAQRAGMGPGAVQKIAEGVGEVIKTNTQAQPSTIQIDKQKEEHPA